MLIKAGVKYGGQTDEPTEMEAVGLTAQGLSPSSQIVGKHVGVQVTGMNIGRPSSSVLVDDQNDNRAMISDGFAWYYTK